MKNLMHRFYILPYASIALVFIYGFNLRLTGDTVALINGLGEALRCLESGQIRCNAGVVHFPIFQYLTGLTFKLFGVSNEALIKIFIGINFFSFLLTLWIFAQAASLAARARAAGHLGILLVLSGYLIWYATASFNEATAFALFSALAYGVIAKWRITIVALLSLLCAITKEVAFPFVAYFLLLAYFAREGQTPLNLKNTLTMIRGFLGEYWTALIAILAGVTINSLFNVFRYGTYKNASNLDPALHTPAQYIPDFYSALFVSPAGGLVYLWLALCVLLIIPLVTRVVRGYHALVLFGAVAGVGFFNLGLAMWYSPFGWYAWGPRLTLPILGAVGVITLYIVGQLLGTERFTKKASWVKNIFYLVILVSTLPNVAALFNEGAFFSKMFAATNVELSSGIKPFSVQTAPPDTYMKASVESLGREIIVPTTAAIIVEKSLAFIILAIAFYAIVMRAIGELLGGKEDRPSPTC